MCELLSGADPLDWADHVASIATAVTAVAAFGSYRLGYYRRKWSLEKYLEERAASAGSEAGKTGMVSLYHLMAKLRMTEDQIMVAAFTNKKVKVWRTVDRDNGRADGIMFSSVRVLDRTWTPVDLLDFDD